MTTVRFAFAAGLAQSKPFHGQGTPMANTHSRLDVAVIGAGLAGAACARALAAAGHRPVLFDKGRGAGGRLSTRRSETPLGEIRIDHGAQYVTARSPSFATFLGGLSERGQAALWNGRVVSIDPGGKMLDLRREDRWIGVPGMSAIVKAALDGLDARFAMRASHLSGAPGTWMVHCDAGDANGPFDRVVLAVPPEQLIDLLAGSDGDFDTMISDARSAVVAPCWAVMGVIDAPFDSGFDGANLLDGDVRWMARKNSRPGQSGPDVWVLHASPEWSRAHLEDAAEAVGLALWEAMQARFPQPPPVLLSAHRWRYALSEQAPGTPFALDASGTVGCAGDWRLGPRAECAWESGEALGEALAGSGSR
ncbi:MAG: NAD(P)/FAD-dependent oxidoreductase [Pseudomonadales bacterium]